MIFIKEKEKKLNGWNTLDFKRIHELIDFITPVESGNVSFSSRLLTDTKADRSLFSKQTILVERIGSQICSAILLSDDGIICPVFSKDTNLSSLQEYLKHISFFSRKYITIMGMQKAVSSLEKFFHNCYRVSIDYDLLASSSSEIQQISSQHIQDAHKNILDKLIIRQAKASDLDRLMPLREKYEIEEVILSPANFNYKACRIRFSDTIKKETVLYGEIDKRAVATCCINAKGLYWDQIGGVYTLPQLRSQGISAALIQRIAALSTSYNKALCLFVKKDNAPAEKLYMNCGFKYEGNYRISYFERR